MALGRDTQRQIRDYIEARKISQEEVALRLGIAQSQVSDQLGRENVTVKSLERIANVLDLEIVVALRPKPD